MELSLLIMDDNSYEREALKSCMNWNTLGIGKIYLAENGKRGWELFEEHQPQIVLSDIKMPEMDGLTFASRVRERNSRAKIIFLSAYDDFEYARCALSQNAFRYLLKPVNSRELTEVVRQAVDEVITQTLDEEERAAFYAMLADIQDAGREKYLKRYLMESMPSSDRGSLYLHMNRVCGLTLAPRMAVAVLRLHQGVEFDRLQSLSHALSDHFSCAAAGFTHGADTVVLVLHRLKGGREELAARAEEALKKTEGSEGMALGVSDLTDNALTLPECYARAEESAGRCEVQGYGRCCFAWDREEAPAPGRPGQTEQLLSQIEAQVRTGRFPGEALERLADGLRGNLDLSEFKGTLIHFVSRLINDRQVRWVCEGDDEVLSEESLYTAIIRGGSVPALTETLREWLQALAERFRFQSMDKKRQTAMEIKQIIDREYAENITLKYLSGRVYLSSNYAHILFKSIYGYTVNHYLTQVRIRKACELLSDTNYPIAQIAPMIGYEHSTYFFSIFKRMIGLTPAEYRRRHQKEAEG